MKTLTLQDRLKNLTESRNQILQQLANLENPSDAISLIKQREQLTGAISIAEVLIQETKETKEATEKIKPK